MWTSRFSLVNFAFGSISSEVNEVGVIVGQPLGSADMADRANGCGPQILRTVGYVVRHCEDSDRLNIEEAA